MVESYRLEDADYAIVGMGTALETAMDVVDCVRKHKKIKVGSLHITSFRPFPALEVVEALKGVKAMAVIERVDIPLMQSNPLTAEIKASFFDENIHPRIYSGVYGLGGRDIRPRDFLEMIQMMKTSKKTRFFTVGIKHPSALAELPDIDVRAPASFSMRGYSIGGYGSVTTNKILATVISELFDFFVQAFPKYGSEKKGLPTNYYLTVSPTPIRGHYELKHVEFVVLNDLNAFNMGDPLEGLAEEGCVYIQTPYTSCEDIWSRISQKTQEAISQKKFKVYALDSARIAREISRSPALIQRMQGIVLLGIFLKVAPFVSEKHMSEEKLFEGVKRSLQKYFGTRGEHVVEDNLKCVKRGYEEVFRVR